MSVRSMIPFLSKADVEASPTAYRVPATPGSNARAFARRQRRANRAAPLLVWPDPPKLSRKEARELRKEIAAARGIKDPDKVDLDDVIPGSDGQSRRRGRRYVERADKRRRLRAQRRFNAKIRLDEARVEKAQAMLRLQEADSPMGANIRSAVDVHLKAQSQLEAKAERRAERRAAHEARRAELGQRPDGRPLVDA